MRSNLSRLTLAVSWGAALVVARVSGAEYLPDAASHLGTVLINQDDLYTTNPLVTLSIRATSNGTGVNRMRFSNDDQNWSTPEPYATSKPWQLPVNDQDFPPSMNTVLKTVYVRVGYGDGSWSKAFSDGIVFARSAQDVPIVTNIWIMQAKPGNFDSTQPQGSQKNPYIVASGANQAAFDTLMNSLATAYSQYRATPSQWQTSPPAMSNVPVMYLHLGAGVFQTHGDYGGRGTSVAWSPTAGGRIRGAGKNSTTLLLVGGNTNIMASVIGNFGGSGIGVYNNLEISDLTVDANMHEGGNTNSSWRRNGIFLAGNNLQLRRLRVQGFGSRIYGMEPAGMSGANASIGNLYNIHIEDCEIVAPQKINRYNPVMLGFEGSGSDASGNSYYLVNIVIRNNYINGLMYDGTTPINAYTNSFYERGSHGIGLGGSRNAIIEDNLVDHVFNGYYNEIYHLNDVLIRNNHFRDVITGFSFNTGAADSFRFEGNLVELDPHYYTTPVSAGQGASDSGWRRGFNLNEQKSTPINRAIVVSNTFQFTDRTNATPPLAASLAAVSLSGSADIEANNVFGFQASNIKWYQADGPPIGYYEQQADVLNPDKPSPITMKNNRRDDGSVIEVYPYVLDQTLPRPVAFASQTISFPAPLIGGMMPTMVTGLPVTNVIDAFGNFTWTPTADNVGRYVVAFYASPNRTNDPRRTLITVLSGLATNDPIYFKSALKGYWKLNETSGSVLADSSGSSNNINVSTTALNYLDLGVPGHRSGQKALHFKNTNPSKGATLVVPKNTPMFFGMPPAYHPLLDQATSVQQPFTVSFWFNCDHEPTNFEVMFNYSYRAIFSVSKSADTNNNIAEVFCVHVYSPDMILYSGMHPQHVKVTVGQWHHFAFVYDSLSTRTYLDGKKAGEVPCGQLENFDPTSAVYLGGGWEGDNYSGSLSELAIWSRALSDQEVADLYFNQLHSGGFPNPRVILSPSNLRISQ